MEQDQTDAGIYLDALKEVPRFGTDRVINQRIPKHSLEILGSSS
jgi:hypothetical protein